LNKIYWNELFSGKFGFINRSFIFLEIVATWSFIELKFIWSRRVIKV
jgi:hypothetical protein